MLQIKTIIDNIASEFDKEVNEALAKGWTLTRRCLVPEGFIAEMEKVIITEAERTCENCKHRNLLPEAEPCFSCSETYSEWEADV
jgi:hypothetical protein